MKTRNTLILFLVTGALFCFIYFWDKNQPSTPEAERRSQNVVNFSPEKITGLVIQNGDDKIELQRKDQKWRLESPIKDQADSSQLDNLLMDLTNWQKDTTISEKEMEGEKGTDKNKLTDFGLNKPKLKLKLLGEGAPPEIWFGKDAAFEGKMYVRFDNSKESYVVRQNIRKEIDKKADDFRDKKLTDLNVTQIGRAIMKTPTGELELEKKDNHWRIVRPLRSRGDDQKIADWLTNITTAQIQQFVTDDRGDLHPYGLAEPRGSITLYPETDKNAKDAKADQGQLLQIGSVPEKQKDQVYVRFAARGFVYALPKKIEEMLNAKPNDLRDRHLVSVDSNILDRITIDAPGKSKILLARNGENWTIASKNNIPANAAEVRRLIDGLTGAEIKQFVEDVASNLPKYGLDKPALTVTLSSFASENTAETKAGEQPIVTINFGKTEGDNTYVHLSDEPFVLAVQPSVPAGILLDPLQWQDTAVFAFKPEQIHRLTITTDKELSLVRGENNQWSWAKGSGPIEQVNLQSLLNTLSSLHAVRWAGATAPGPGFGKTQFVITFTTSPDDKAVHKLTVGGPSDNGMWFAKVDEKEGIFVLSNPDLSAFKLPLVQTELPAAAASASPGASGSPAASAARPAASPR